MSRFYFIFRVALLCSSLTSATRAADDSAFRKFAVATVHPLATEAAANAFDHGGNAIDAAIAAGLTLGVVDGHNSGIGGGCFILIRSADGSFTCIDGRETAPAGARRDMYVINGKLDDEASKTGALASAVPGVLRGYELALKKHGKLKLADLLNPAADLAERGFEMDEFSARRVASVAEKMKRFPASAEIFLHADGKPLGKGDRLVQKDLAATYRAVATQGTGWFYEGEFAKRTDKWMSENGGVMTATDLAGYQPKLREPLRTKYRGYDIIGMPPPSSGGVHVAQILQMMEGFPIATMEPAERVHVTAEAMKLAFADRAYWLGDPDFVKVPRGLIDLAYTKELAAKINPKHAATVTGHGLPPRWAGDVFGKHTTHLCTADAEGNWVAITQTINTTFGSKVVIPGTGVVMNDEMDDFSAQPGKPNAFGLVGAEANAIGPGKRPLSSMSPTIVLKDGQPIVCTGAAGGPTIITQVVLTLSGVIDLGLSPADALKQPRFHHQWSPDELKVETSLGDETMKKLEAKGHRLEKTSKFGACQMIQKDSKQDRFTPASDPRVNGAAAGR
jgi:gamma-glutamyltranspeptidase/glutathione hydrolase